jgi:hypothetical protein
VALPAPDVYLLNGWFPLYICSERADNALEPPTVTEGVGVGKNVP